MSCCNSTSISMGQVSKILHGVVGGEGNAFKRLRVPHCNGDYSLVGPLEGHQYLWSESSGCYYFGFRGQDNLREYLDNRADDMDKCRKCCMIGRNYGYDWEEIRLCAQCNIIVCISCDNDSRTCGQLLGARYPLDEVKLLGCGVTYCSRCVRGSPIVECGSNMPCCLCPGCRAESCREGYDCTHCLKAIEMALHQEEIDAKQAVIDSQQDEIEKLRKEIEALRARN